jgi:signal peptidase II
VVGGLLVVAVDQLVKWAVVRAIPAGSSVAVIPGVLSLTHVQNTGIAFGWFAGVSPAIAAIAALLLFAVLFSRRRGGPTGPTEQVGISLMAGGALGNLLDRIRLGFVVDYLDVHVWPVFNVADVTIVVGGGLLVLTLAREGRPPQSGR